MVANDYGKFELDDNGPLSAKAGDSAAEGILVELPERLTHWGGHSFMAEESFMNEEKMDKMLKIWKARIGKRCYWLALQEKGAILRRKNGKRYAYVKLSSVFDFDEDLEDKAESILDSRGGAFSA